LAEEASQLRRRLLACDATLWPEGNVSSDRLGWLEVPRQLEAESRSLASFATAVDQDTVVLLGMGGSSLGPAVLAAVRDSLGEWEGRRFIVCDSTDPATVAALPLEEAFMVVSSKSGTTLEPNVLFEYARSRMKDPGRYCVITDPGTPLESLAGELGIKNVFLNRPDIGGRYSVLSHFGMVPAALAGYDVAELCGRALDADAEEAVALGVSLGGDALSGRDKATIVVNEPFRSFGLWVEQLIAESTGKEGKGLVPVPTTEPESGEDRHLVGLSLRLAHELGEQFYRFELAIATAGHVLQIDPFDEPNVAESKANTARVLEALPLPKLEASPPSDVMSFISANRKPGDYVSLQAYLPLGQDAALEAARRRIRDHNGGMAVTAGYGPRFLHSTGQLHKGGPNSLIAVQVVPPEATADVPIPAKPYDFGTLIGAQAIGDHESLVAHGRRVLRVATEDLAAIA
jgi:glucose-6-phosphate isomerase/transaldolase/glucose-6-phosphate isomerase